MRKRFKIGALVLLCICVLIGAKFGWPFLSPYFAPENEWDMVAEGETGTGQVYDGPVFYNKNTGQIEQYGPMPEAEALGEEYISFDVRPSEGKISDEILLTPTNHGPNGWMLVDADMDQKIRRLTVTTGTIMGVSELADRGPVYVQVDIEKDGEWVFGAKQEVSRNQICQIILPKRSAFRVFLWTPEGDDWVMEFSHSSRWW